MHALKELKFRIQNRDHRISTENKYKMRASKNKAITIINAKS